MNPDIKELSGEVDAMWEERVLHVPCFRCVRHSGLNGTSPRLRGTVKLLRDVYCRCTRLHPASHGFWVRSDHTLCQKDSVEIVM